MEEESDTNKESNGTATYEYALRLKEYHDWIFEAKEGEKSVRDQIDAAATDLDSAKKEYKAIVQALDDYRKQLLGDSEEEPSTKKEFEKLLSTLNEKLNKVAAIEKKVDSFHEMAFEGSTEAPSYEAQFKNSVKQIGIDLKEGQEQLRVLKAFYDKVVDTQGSDGKKIPGLENKVNELHKRLNSLITDANTKLHALTDSALHNAFASRAANYTKEFQKLERYTTWAVGALILDILLFGGAQWKLISDGQLFNYHLLIYQFSIAGALIFAIWMFNRNQKIAKKLAEEYHHKASLAEAMTGYRSLYQLDHDDEEYLALFNAIKDQLNVNPSKQIDTFLNLKSPHEEISASLTDLSKQLGSLSKDQLEQLQTTIKSILDKK